MNNIRPPPETPYGEHGDPYGLMDITNRRQKKNILDPQKKYRLGTVSEIFY